MPVSSIGDGGVHNGGVFCQCGVYKGSIPSLFGDFFVGLHILLRLLIIYYACGYLITRADTDMT